MSQFLFSLAILSSHGFKNNYAPAAALSIHLQQCLSHCVYDNYILSHLSCPLARKLQEGWDHLPCSPSIPMVGLNHEMLTDGITNKALYTRVKMPLKKKKKDERWMQL